MTDTTAPADRAAPRFDDDDLSARLDAMSDDERHALPFGVIGLDPAGRVRFYSRTESIQSGYGDRPILGLDFFGQVAPCLAAHDFQARLRADQDAGQLDIEVGHTGDFADRSRFLRVRAMSAAGGGLWLAHQRPAS